MPNLKELRQRGSVVASIGRMAGAMKMVSQAHFNRTQVVLKGARTMDRILAELVDRLTCMLGEKNKAPEVGADGGVGGALGGGASGSLDGTSVGPAASALDGVSVDPSESGLDGGLIDSSERILDGSPVDPLVWTRPGPATAPWVVLVLTADAGMCGGFISKIVKAAEVTLVDLKRPVEVICVGKKAPAAMMRLKGRLKAQSKTSQPMKNASTPKFSPLGPQSIPGDGLNSPFAQETIGHAALSGQFQEAERQDALQNQSQSWRTVPGLGQVVGLISEELMGRFLAGQIAGCTLVYSKFYNRLRQEPVAQGLFPLALPKNGSGELTDHGLMQVYPSLEEALARAIKLYVAAHTSSLTAEHRLSEYGARMAAMDSATENAKDMQNQLRLQYNHLRQSLITKELIEIISGAEAISGS
jgi:F-type H+-transporting ATPase subunit gamma